MTTPAPPRTALSQTLATPLGPLLIWREEGDHGGLLAVEFADHADRLTAGMTRDWGASTVREDPEPERVAGAFGAYFAGDVTALETLPVRVGGSAFRQAAWAYLRTIPAGETRSYADQARAMGKAGAVRAVGSANGANPLGLVVPCHRVVQSGGGLGGYAGGVARKAWLLAHEARHSSLRLSP
jgi:methylated-DNA-[protein]-cysteine S-methyltransferase